jgi:hypothetical protein
MDRRFVFCAVALGVTLGGAATADAVQYGLGFSGSVESAKAAYGYTVPMEAAVYAQLIYDSTTAPNYNLGGCDCATYRQRISDGLSVTFGGLVVQSDEYDIHVMNNIFNTVTQAEYDLIRVVFSSAQNPSFETSLEVNGVAQPDGELVLYLRDRTATVLQSSALPDPAAFNGLEFYKAFLRDSPTELAYDLAANLNPPTLLDSPEGDFNSDAAVDGADFLMWQRSIGADGSSPADGDGSGVVDGEDLAMWSGHYGETFGSPPAAVSVAEPTASALALSLLAGVALLRRDRRRCELR